MKFYALSIFTLFCVKSYAQAQKNVFLNVVDETNVYALPDIIKGIIRTTIKQGDSCIVVGWNQEKSTVPTDWLFVLTYDGPGYIYAQNYPLPDSILNVIKDSSSFKFRYALATTYFEDHRESIKKQKLAILKEEVMLTSKRIKQLEDSLSKFGFIINYDWSNSYNSVNLSVNIINCRKTKIVKYIFLTFTAYNPVKDKITTKIIRGIGPVEPFQTGEYEFKSVFYTNVFDYCKLNALKIIYMDGSTETLNSTNPVVKKANNTR